MCPTFLLSEEYVDRLLVNCQKHRFIWSNFIDLWGLLVLFQEHGGLVSAVGISGIRSVSKKRYGLCNFSLYHGHYGFCEMSLFLIIRSLTMTQSSLCVD